ncbi:MAG: cation:proton antiporter [Prochlorotrichaceae cyanobacterium]|jgi:Kef-type K+ transport system membrane component KefB/nucleotide-binding universal stress UspA family protein
MVNLLSQLADSPIVTFTILLLISVTVPPLFEQLKVPGLVGLLVAGICVGPEGLNVINPDSDTMKLLSDVGKIYLMFVAGLEIDLADFYRTRDRSLTFGFTTFAVPMITGIGVGLAFKMGLNAAVLLGSLMASHTLLGYPIVARMGLLKHDSITATVGATIFTDIGALLVLAICVGVNEGDFTTATLVGQVGSLAIYTVLVLLGIDRIGKSYFKRMGDEEGNQFLFVLLAVFLASVGAQLINVDKIVGAFLAGLAINGVVGKSPLQEKVVFVGSTLFIPFFFIDMGLLLSISGLIQTLSSQFLLTAAIVLGLIGSKFLAALAVKGIYRYRWIECLTMWSLSLPQVAATLAAAIVGVEAGVIDISIFNAVIVLMLVTAIAGPILTAKFARRLSPIPLADPETLLEHPGDALPGPLPQTTDPTGVTSLFTILIPLCNPYSQRYLIEVGALLARQESGRVLALSIAKSHVHMDSPELDSQIQQSQRLLQSARQVGEELGTIVEPLLRIDDDVAHGITRAAREQNARLIIMGWSQENLQARIFGSVTDSVLWSAHCPVAAMRLMDDPINLHRILIPVAGLAPQDLRPIRLAQLFAETNQGEITLLHVYHPKISPEAVETFENRIRQHLAGLTFTHPCTITTRPSRNIASTILEEAKGFDLVVLRSLRRRTVAGLEVSNMTTEIILNSQCSLILVGEPHYGLETVIS